MMLHKRPLIAKIGFRAQIHYGMALQRHVWSTVDFSEIASDLIAPRPPRIVVILIEGIKHEGPWQKDRLLDPRLGESCTPPHKC